jgi:hypothetical protein
MVRGRETRAQRGSESSIGRPGHNRVIWETDESFAEDSLPSGENPDAGFAVHGVADVGHD